MDQSCYLRAINLGICPNCMVLFLDRNDKRVLGKCDNEVLDYISSKSVSLFGNKDIIRTATETYSAAMRLRTETPSGPSCVCCLDFLSNIQIDTLLQRTLMELGKNVAMSKVVRVVVTYSPTLEIARAATRIFVTDTDAKVIILPRLETIIGRVLIDKLCTQHSFRYRIVEDEHPDALQVLIFLTTSSELY